MTVWLIVLMVVGTGIGVARTPVARADDGVVITLNSPDRAFSPNGDNQEDQAFVAFELSASARISIAIADDRGQVVRHLETAVDRTAGSQSVSWDGRLDGGQLAPDGVYAYTVTATSPSGAAQSAGGLIGVDARIPVRLVSPAADATVSGPLSVKLQPVAGLSLNDVLVQAVSCHVYFADPGCYQQIYAPDLDGGMTAALDADNWLSGANGLDAVTDYTDQFGQSHRYRLVRLPITVRRSARITSLSPDRSFSPDRDGQDDFASVSYELWTPAHVDVVVRDADGKRVRQIEAGASHPERSEVFSWDGRDDAGSDVDDGEYTYTITAQGAVGEPAVAGGRIGVDRRAPVRMTAPVPHAQLSGVTHVRLAAADGLNLQYAQVSVDACEDASLNGTYWGNCQNYASTVEPDGSMLLDLDTDSWRGGPNMIRSNTSFTDVYGQAHNYTVPGVDVVVPRAVQIANVSVDRYFSPDDDGVDDTGDVSYHLTADAQTSVVITDDDGRRVRTLETDVPQIGYWSGLSWDGRDDEGDVMPDGVYRYTITAKPSDGGSPAIVTGRLGIDTRVPATVAEPVSDATLSGVAHVRIAPADDLTLTSAQTSVDNCENPNLNDTYWGNCNAVANDVQPDGSLGLDMDTNSWRSGPNTIRPLVYYNDQFGQSHRVSLAPISVTAPRGLLIQSLSPDRDFSPGDDGYEDVAQLAFWLTAEATTTITVAHSDGNVLRTIESGVNHAYGWQYFDWDGRDDDGKVVPDGVYTYKITGHIAGGDPVSATGQVGVDTRVPATIVEPVSGAELAGVIHGRVKPRDGLTLTGIQLAASGCEAPWLGGTYWGNCNAYSNDPLSDGSFVADVNTDAWAAGDNGISATLQYADRFGQGHSYTVPALAVTVSRVERITDVSPDRYFGHPEEPTVATSFYLSTAALTTVVISDGDGTTVRHVETDRGRSAGYQYFEWDGLDDDGHALAEGVYRYTIDSRPAKGEPASFSGRLGIDRRAPGTIQAPQDGDTVSGIAQLAFAPRSDLTTQSVDFCAYGNAQCVSVFGAPGSGLWHTSRDTLDLPDGPLTITARVTYADPFGQPHGATLSRSVEVDNTTPSADLVVTPVSGTSPLAGTIKLIAYQPRGVALDYTVDFGDGTTSATGHVEAPYAPISLGHTFADPGTYHVHASVGDGHGHVASRTLDVTVNAPPVNHAPVAALVVDPGAGAAPLDVEERVSAADPDNDPLTYKLDYGDGDSSTGDLPHASVGHTYTAAGSYLVRLTVSDGKLTDARTTRVEVADVTPPETTITDGPQGEVSDLAPFSFGSSEDHSSFDCAIDDGAFANCLSPFTPFGLAAGAHSFRVRATDGAGNHDLTPATRQFTLRSSTANTAPEVTLSLDAHQGAAPLALAATIAATDADDDPLTYSLDWGDGGALDSGTLPGSTVRHSYNHPGSYLVRLALSDGTDTAVRTTTVDVALGEPLTADAGDDQTISAGEPITLDGGGSRPAAGIERYRWKFGDGTDDADGASAKHTYATAGTYTATLSVTAGDKTQTDTTTLTVVQQPATAAIGVDVTDASSHEALSATQVLIITADGKRISDESDSAGRAALVGVPDGDFTFYAYRSGYRPDTGSLHVADGAGTAAIALTPGQIATTQLDSHRMTLDEILAAGIDPDDPANQHVFQFEIHLAFTPTADPVVFTGYATGGGFYGAGFGGGGGGGGGGSCTAEACRTSVGGTSYEVRVTWIGDEPMLQWLIIPGKAKFLKEFFDISMVVQNLAAPAFKLQSGHAQLSLPQGLNLAPTPTPQSLSTDMLDIPGGQAATVHWLVRGDDEGSYSPSASYSGLLQPVGVPVSLQAQLAEPLKVWGGSALKMIVDAADHAVAHAPYTIRVGLKNVADVPVYNPAVELSKAGKLNYIYQPRERLEQSSREVDPGDTFWADYILVPQFSGTLVVEKSFVKKTGGDVSLDSTIVSHPSTPPLNITSHARKDAVVVQWDPVPGADGYAVYRTPDDNTDFPDAPLETRQLSPTKVLISAPHQDHSSAPPWYAVSPLVDGKPAMAHAMIQSAGEEESPYPTSRVNVQPDCDHQQATLAMSFADPDFTVVQYEVRRVGKDWGAPISLPAGTNEATFTVTAEMLGYAHQVRAANTEGEWGPVEDVHTNVCGTYIALGDSFSAGEGNPPFDHPTDQDGDGCHRSSQAYPAIVGNALLVAKEVHSFTSRACSGAHIADITNPNGDNGLLDSHGNPVEDAQVNHLDPSTKLVTLTIGGNDALFAWVLTECVAQGVVTLNTQPCVKLWAPVITALLPKIYGDLIDTYQAIRDRAPNARILVLGYPDLVPLVAPLTCLGISLLDTAWIHEMILAFDDIIHEAVSDSHAGAEYIEAPSYSGHEVCPTNPFNDAWVNPILPSHLKYSFHPNGTGQQKLADAILGALHGDGGSKAFTLGQGEVGSTQIDIAPGQAQTTFATHWTGSTFKLSLESPSGRHVDGDTTADDVDAAAGPTFQTITVKHPESGAWKVTVTAVDVPREGEAVLLTDDSLAPDVNTPPTSQFTVDPASGTAPLKVVFDGEVAFDVDSAIATYAWDFGDGGTATVAEADHTYAHPGEYTVKLTVTDDQGAKDSSTQTVTVSAPAGGDTTQPVLHGMPGDRDAEAAGHGGAQVTYPSPTATDDVDGTDGVTCSPTSGATFALGTTTVTCSTQDGAGNKATASFKVTVQDTTAPSLHGVPTDIAQTATVAAGVPVNYTKPMASDTVDGEVPVSCEPAPGATFPVGRTAVRCKGTDAHGNVATATFMVTITVVSPVTQLARLQDAVAGPDVPRSVQRTLTSDLVDARTALSAGRPASACTAMTRFDVDLASAKGLTPATVALLQGKSDGLATSLDCDHQIRLVGADRVGSNSDNNNAGVAEAFRATADVSGTARHLRVRLSTTKASPKQLVVGMYANDGGHPGKLLASGLATSPTKGWTEVTVPAITLKAGTRYWLALLSPQGSGVVFFQDGPSNAADRGPSETSKSAKLAALPATWKTGTRYQNAPLSGYGRP